MSIKEVIENVEKQINLDDCIKTEVETLVHKLVENEIKNKKEKIKDKESIIQDGSELVLKYIQIDMCNGCSFLGCHDCRRLWWL